MFLNISTTIKIFNNDEGSKTCSAIVYLTTQLVSPSILLLPAMAWHRAQWRNKLGRMCTTARQRSKWNWKIVQSINIWIVRCHLCHSFYGVRPSICARRLTVIRYTWHVRCNVGATTWLDLLNQTSATDRGKSSYRWHFTPKQNKQRVDLQMKASRKNS